jgi:hypothetical protein
VDRDRSKDNPGRDRFANSPVLIPLMATFIMTKEQLFRKTKSFRNNYYKFRGTNIMEEQIARDICP